MIDLTTEDVELTTNINYLHKNKFRMLIDSVTKKRVQFTVQNINFDGLSIEASKVKRMGRDMAISADTLTYGNLTVDFLILEDMSNYVEIHDWIEASVINQDGKEDNKRKDMTLMVYSSHNNPIAEIQFINAFPIEITGIEFDSTVEDMKYATATATFMYDYHKIKML